MAAQHRRIGACSQNPVAPATAPRERAEAIQSQRKEWKCRKLLERRPHVQIYSEVRRIKIRGSRQPSARLAEIETAEQEHRRPRREHQQRACQIDRGDHIPAEQAPRFRNGIEERRTENEQGLPVAAAEVRRPTWEQDPVRQVPLHLDHAREIFERVMPRQNARREQRDHHRE